MTRRIRRVRALCRTVWADQLRSLKVRISAGVVDAGLSSLQGFAVGLAAVTMLDPASLGVYAVFYAACQLAMALPSELVSDTGGAGRSVAPRTEAARRASPLAPSGCPAGASRRAADTHRGTGHCWGDEREPPSRLGDPHRRRRHAGTARRAHQEDAPPGGSVSCRGSCGNGDAGRIRAGHRRPRPYPDRPGLDTADRPRCGQPGLAHHRVVAGPLRVHRTCGRDRPSSP